MICIARMPNSSDFPQIEPCPQLQGHGYRGRRRRKSSRRRAVNGGLIVDQDRDRI